MATDEEKLIEERERAYRDRIAELKGWPAKVGGVPCDDSSRPIPAGPKPPPPPKPKPKVKDA